MPARSNPRPLSRSPSAQLDLGAILRTGEPKFQELLRKALNRHLGYEIEGRTDKALAEELRKWIRESL